ncbi:hypothetical protein C9439_02135 [archaeon SCG-AAA382B04]|nr:hypothetical protein C9439_02135 [archaeon SCG-AAA382B04]
MNNKTTLTYIFLIALLLALIMAVTNSILVWTGFGPHKILIAIIGVIVLVCLNSIYLKLRLDFSELIKELDEVF